MINYFPIVQCINIVKLLFWQTTLDKQSNCIDINL